MFSQFFHSRKMDLYALNFRALLQTKGEIRHHSIVFLQLVKSPPFYIH